MTARGIKIFFKNKGGVFFSLLSVIIIFCLFIFFIGDSITSGLDFLDNAQYVMNSWVVAGMLASSSITTSMGAYALMVSDKENKSIKDFYSSPLKRSDIVAGYMCTGLIISIVMSVITFIFGEIYIVINGGNLADFTTIIKVFGVILLSSFSSSAMVCFIVSFVKNMSTYTTISIILGTLIGFLVGAYVCIGDLPTGVQWVIKCFPCAHSAVLFRQLLMADGINSGFSDLSDNVLTEFLNQVGATFEYGDWKPKMWFHVSVLIVTGILFYLLAIINMSRKAKKY
jgi:multidrug/hemolysin transport system permease protein